MFYCRFISKGLPLKCMIAQILSIAMCFFFFVFFSGLSQWIDLFLVTV